MFARAVFAVFLLGVLFAPLPGRADQTDVRLKALFAQLKDAKDIKAAAKVTALIWDIWAATDSREAQRHYLQGLILMHRDRYPEAVLNFDEAIRLAPKFSEAWNKRATVYFLMGNFDASVADIKQTLVLEPRHFGALAGLGMIYRELGDDKAALRAYEKALSYNPHLTNAKAVVKEIREKLKGERT